MPSRKRTSKVEIEISVKRRMTWTTVGVTSGGGPCVCVETCKCQPDPCYCINFKVYARRNCRSVYACWRDMRKPCMLTFSSISRLAVLRIALCPDWWSFRRGKQPKPVYLAVSETRWIEFFCIRSFLPLSLKQDVAYPSELERKPEYFIPWLCLYGKDTWGCSCTIWEKEEVWHIGGRSMISIMNALLPTS